MVGTNQLFIVIEGHKESAPAVHIPKLRRPYHSYPYNEICTNGYAHTGVSSPFAIHCTLSIVIGRDLRALESLSNQILYLIEPTMSCKVAHTPDEAQLLPQCTCKDSANRVKYKIILQLFLISRCSLSSPRVKSTK